MKGDFESWLVCLAVMGVSGFFLYRSLRDVVVHSSKYQTEKAADRVRWWYVEWVFIAVEAVFGTLTRPAAIISLLFFAVGAIGFVINSFSILAGTLK